jgi:hypothetical protein
VSLIARSHAHAHTPTLLSVARTADGTGLPTHPPLHVLGGDAVATGAAGEAEGGVLETVPEDEERIRQLEKEELSSDSEDGDKEPETAHLVLAQFDKVSYININPAR